MSMFDDMKDKASDLAGEHEEQVDQGIETGGDRLDEMTGNKYSGQIDKGQEFADDNLGDANNA